MLPSEAIEYIELDQSDVHYSARIEAVCDKLRRRDIQLLSLVTGIKDFLLSDVRRTRGRAALLLAEVVRLVPACLSSQQEVHHMCEFFSARLVDSPTVLGGATGCTALLQRNTQGAHDLPVLSTDDIITVATTLKEHVPLQLFAIAERLAGYGMWLACVQVHGSLLLDQGFDLLGSIIAAMDGEKDPRCLLQAFTCVREVVSLYTVGGEDNRKLLSDHMEELCDVCSCYFPISFTPPPNDPHGITRQMLSHALRDTLTVSPLMAQHCLPVVMEKLESNVRQAKIDALDLLGMCPQAYGSSALTPHLADIWSALRSEIFPPIGPGPAPLSDSVRQEALSCLTGCEGGLASLGDMSLVGAVLGDGKVQLGVQYLVDGSAGSSTECRGVVSAATDVWSAVCKGHVEAAARVCASVLPQLLTPFQAPASSSEDSEDCPKPTSVHQHDHQALLLSTLVSLVSATRTACTAASTSGATASKPPLAHAAGQLMSIACGIGGAETAQEGSVSCDAARLKLIGQLLAYPTGWIQLSSQQEQQGMDVIVNVMVGLHSGEDSEQLQPAIEDALQQLAETRHVGQFRDYVIPRLVDAVLSPSNIAAPPPPQLSLLATLSTCTAVLHQAVLQQLHRLLEADEQLLPPVLSFASDVLAEGGDGGVDDVVQAMLQLPVNRRAQGLSPLAPKSLQLMCRAIAAGMQACGVAQQEPLVRAACTSFASWSDKAATGAALGPEHVGHMALLVAARPEALSSAGLPPLSQVFAALCGCAVFCPEEGTVGVARVAAASVLNKCDAATRDQLLSMMPSHVQQHCDVHGALAGTTDVAQVRCSFQLLGWLLRGVALLSSSAAQSLVDILLHALKALCEHKGSDKMDVEGADGSTTISTITSLGMVCSTSFAVALGSTPDMCLPLDKVHYCVIKPLWQQKFFVTTLGKLEEALKACRGLPNQSHTLLLLPFSLLVTSCPLNITKMEASRVLPWLLEALDLLPQSSYSDAGVLVGVMLFVSSLVMEDKGRDAVCQQLPSVVSTLLALVSYRPAFAVRETALQCLLALMDLPYAKVHPYKTHVLRVVTKALDDGKRSVRQAAVSCRQAWNINLVI